ncbi:Ig-like domain-containing protein [Polaribacter sp. Z014]|uniref:Ig-like domain-containing protein n=1 Tax=unclassified Polaribacter TaxID=196858 RepID=UPI00193BBD83|nr:Ig-like domain-containing protein [Polaribacter sp. Q13]MCL7761794.1 Ig-like domain-containing protein [Polaribacter sp. Z014]QVY64807.1 Ig-like domain-containing protein [Polaribacter sp. Q13]
MKPIFRFIFFSISIVILTNCARTGNPEGGPKDEDAPLFVTSKPAYETINFDAKEIELNFNEYIKLKDLNKQLIVSPPLKTPLLVTPQSTASKFLNIQILDTLIKNTTYIINFGNAIEDNNEGNKLESFKYVFSTGKYIDSLSTSGKIKDAYSDESQKNINVLLYKIDSSFTDSIVFKNKPNYVTNSLDTSLYNLTNLKEGKYLMIALKETTNDYLFNPKEDKIGFFTDTITLPRDSIIKKPIVLFKETQPYQFKRGKEITRGKIEFGYEGEIKDLKVKIISDTPDDFKSVSKFEIDKDTLNYWYKPFEADSLNFIVTNDNFIDTVTVKLRKKKIDSLILSASTEGTLHLRDTFFMKGNNPLVKIDTSKITLVDKDTLTIPFVSFISDKENKIALVFNKKPQQKYALKMMPEAISDIFEQKNDTLNYKFTTKEIEDYGRITMDIVNETSNHLIIELLEGKDKDKLIETKFISGSGQIQYNLLEPKKYYIRAIVDENKNNKWDTGNYLLKQQPEKIIYYSEELEVRANYYLDGNVFTVKIPE